MKKTASPKAAAKPSKPTAKVAGQPAAKPQPAEAENLTLDQIKELIHLIAEKQFTDFELERGAFRLRLGRGSTTKVVTETVSHNFASEAVPAPAAVPAVVAPAPASPEEALHIIASPLVGTFYRSSSPATESFVNIGDPITNGETLCIVEAMKLMNEIQADTDGIIAKIFVENAQPVEYGQPLFGIKV